MAKKENAKLNAGWLAHNRPEHPASTIYPYPLVSYTDYYQQNQLQGYPIYPWDDGFISKFDLSNLVGVGENPKSNLEILFENPVANNLHLVVSADELLSLPVSIIIFDETGRKVMVKKLGKLGPKFSADINVSTISAGFYTASIFIGQNLIPLKLIKL